MLVTTTRGRYYSPRSIPERVLAAGVACASRRAPTSHEPRGDGPHDARARARGALARVRSAQLEGRTRRSRSRDDAAAQLAQPESRFERFAVGDDELSLHWLEVPSSTAESATRPLVHCNHGFGASALSWRPCMRGSPTRWARVAVAHDAPAFGLTRGREGRRRVHARANAALTTELVSRVGARAPEGGARAPPCFAGHSMGAHSAIRAALDACDARDAGPRVARLVAPRHPLHHRESRSARPPARAWPARAPQRVRGRASRGSFPERASAAAGRALARLASVPLRRLVFGRGSGSAVWRWPGTPARARRLQRMARDYALPSRVRGWEDGMLRFVLARGREGDSPRAARDSSARARAHSAAAAARLDRTGRARPDPPPANAPAARRARRRHGARVRGRGRDDRCTRGRPAALWRLRPRAARGAAREVREGRARVGGRRAARGWR